MVVVERLFAFVLLLVLAWLAVWFALWLPRTTEVETDMAVAAIYVLKGASFVIAGLSFYTAFAALIGKLD